MAGPVTAAAPVDEAWREVSRLARRTRLALPGTSSNPVRAASEAVLEAAELTARAATYGPPELARRDLLQEALACVRAASSAIRFALTDDGDRRRDTARERHPG